MSDVLKELVDLLALERLEENLFRGRSQDLGWGQVFGGQVLGQALSAAAQTVPAERGAHSLHGYFLRPGDVGRPIVYDVDRIRDGRSFTTRRVVAIQKGRPIFNLAASFMADEPGFEHQDLAPEVAGPEGLPSHLELTRKWIERVPEQVRAWAQAERPIETRPVDPVDPMDPKPGPARRAIWYRAAGPLPDDQALHRYLLAYASDFHFLVTSLLPHGVSWLSSGMQVASLDHAMWFHRPVRMDQWLLFDMESPSASGARGIARGRFFDQQGALVATVAQEGLMRRWEKGKG